MSKKRLLFVTQELNPYTAVTAISDLLKDFPQRAQEEEFDVRILMPRFGTINERRHKLHEVVRLSGMNIIVDDDDYPLLIKVASLPGARLQVYFLDNEEFFKRKYVFTDEDNEPFDDNAERMIFFCKGVIETVKKFGWGPDIIYCHGWLTSLVPLYVKKAYASEPLFHNSTIIYGAYNGGVALNFTEEFVEKATINDLEYEDLEEYFSGGEASLHIGASHYSDALVIGSDDLSKNVVDFFRSSGKPVIEIKDKESFAEQNIDLLKSLVAEQEESK